MFVCNVCVCVCVCMHVCMHACMCMSTDPRRKLRKDWLTNLSSASVSDSWRHQTCTQVRDVFQRRTVARSLAALPRSAVCAARVAASPVAARLGAARVPPRRGRHTCGGPTPFNHPPGSCASAVRSPCICSHRPSAPHSARPLRDEIRNTRSRQCRRARSARGEHAKGQAHSLWSLMLPASPP
jgi:hypothetical protein